MSKLYYSEEGRVIASLCEELTAYRRARKLLSLPGTREPATLFLLARSYPGSEAPLHVSVNGSFFAEISPKSPDIYFWREITVPSEAIIEGVNAFEFWTDSQAMNAWSLALEPGHRDPQSQLSTDGGRTWRNERLGFLHACRGEYVVRVRLAEGNDPPPPPMCWEDPTCAPLTDLRRLLPREASQPGETLTRVRALTSWVCTRWEYRCTDTGVVYAPWDAQTIIAWGEAQKGHNGLLPVVMCVQYGVTLVSACAAVGIPARCAVFTGEINGFNGHFTAEVWLPEHQKWVMVDPTLDAVLFAGETPLSVSEIQKIEGDLTAMVHWGPGYAFQRRNPVIVDWVRNNFSKGICFRHRSLWPRTDFLSHPELTPPGHGVTSYCETDLVWEARDLDQGFGMFPSFADENYFNAPPEGFTSA